MFKKLSKKLCGFFVFVSAFVTMSLPALAANPLMGDDTQDTVKLMTILLIVSAVLIIALVSLSLLKKKGKK